MSRVARGAVRGPRGRRELLRSLFLKLPAKPVSVMILVAVGLLGPTTSGAESNETAAYSHTRAIGSTHIMISMVYDNYPFDERLEPAWGFSCIIEGLARTILFDTGGNGDLLLHNMRKLQFRPEQIDVVVLSHTRGLETFLRVNSKVQVYLPRAFPSGFKQGIERLGAAIVETDGPCKVCDDAWTTGVLGASIREQGLYLKTDNGLVVITGCAHPGIVNITDAARRHAHAAPHAVLGGFHMAGASTGEIRLVITRLSEMGVQKVGPCHCSGDETRRLMKQAFLDGYLPAGVGAQLAFEKEVEN